MLAFHYYADQTQQVYLPPLYTVDTNGRPLHSWCVHILPFIDEDELFGQIGHEHNLHQFIKCR